MTSYYLGVDVGTGSARAGIFDSSGRRYGIGMSPIEIFRPHPDHVEQSSNDIWIACCKAVRQAVVQSGVAVADIKGIAFDATCSMVIVDEAGNPVAVNAEGDDQRNTIVWMDHRATEQAHRINSLKHPVLSYVGGKISPEMQTPKLLWIKENLPDCWSKAAYFFDLTDFLTWRSTGSDVRSLCTTVCKWTYIGHESRWDDSYFRDIGLGSLTEEGYARIGTDVRPMGEPIGSGLTVVAAEELGLKPGTTVAVGAIDAHAGGLGVIGASRDDLTPDEKTLLSRLALVTGTSNCHMALSGRPTEIPGVWGPYWSAMVPGLWLNEGGQSAAGALIDHIIYGAAQNVDILHQAKKNGQSVYDVLNDIVIGMESELEDPLQLTADIHVFPDFHGNRSPRAEPDLRGMICGLKLSQEPGELARLYLATIRAIAYGTRHIIEALRSSGLSINTLMLCGGGAKNPILLREYANATGCVLALPVESEAMLLGSAILAATASGEASSVNMAMSRMTRIEEYIEPSVGAVREYHDRKYKVFLRMYEDQRAYNEIMR